MADTAFTVPPTPASLTTPVVADAVVRLGLVPRQAPVGIAGPAGAVVAGRALPVRHAGSVDVFLEVLGDARQGDVLVVDNGGRRDEACIGDLVVHEARLAGVVGVVIWGLHRDVAEIEALDVPVFSYGVLPFGPLTPRPSPAGALATARFGDVAVTPSDVVVADRNGVIFLPGGALDRILEVATAIRDTEAEQIRRLRSGTSLREQLDFAAYLRDRDRDPTRTFRDHLRDRDRAIEE